MIKLEKIVLALLVTIFFGCLVKEKSEKFLRSGSMNPPWESSHFIPKRLEAYSYSGPESLFTVFKVISNIDSLSGEMKNWKADPDAEDTTTISQVFDSGFVFPENPTASMAYAYDESYRDDTLFRFAYGNGLFTQDHPCAKTVILSSPFLHPARWVSSGMKMEDVLSALGKPMYKQKDVLRYLAKYNRSTIVIDSTQSKVDSSSLAVLKPAIENNPLETFEGLNFYFQNDSLFAVVLQQSQPCH